MKTLIKILSYLGLVMTIVPAFLVFFGIIGMEENKRIMAVGMLVWFVTAPFWMNKKEEETL